MTQTATGCRLRFDDHTLDLSWYGPDIVRVRAWPGDAPPSRPSLSVIASPSAPAGWRLETDGDDRILAGPGLSVRIGPTGRLSFLRGDRVLLTEQAGGRVYPENSLPNPEDRRGAEQSFDLHPVDALYGLGQFPDGVMSWRGQSATLIHGNVTVVVPFLVSTGGWGMLWDNPSHTTFADGPDGMRWWSEVADGIDYYLVTGGTPDAVIAGYRRLTGAAPLFPRAFLGFIQCKERYQTADELVEVVREHRRRGLPLDVIVQDWRYWGDSPRWSGMRHDPETYGDLPAAVRAVHDLNAKLMISIWPAIGPDTDLYRELEAGGHLFPAVHWSGGRIYDAFSPEARAVYWRHLREGLFDLGIDAWWMDGTEPEFEDCHDQTVHKASLLAQPDTAAGSWARVLNAFSLATTGGVYDGHRAATAAKRVFILTRSAFAGQQRFGAATWSGDVSANWRTFRNQIPAGLNVCLAGIPYWTTDNGGFFVAGRGGAFPEGVRDPAFREFFLRWFQYSCFCPLMRSHGTQTPREIWQFGGPGDSVYDSLVAFARLRMRLLPYSYSLAALTTRDGHTPMRALAMDFPDDTTVHAVADQFMYGPALMACPVVRPMVHFPAHPLEAFLAAELADPDGTPGGLRMAFYDGSDADTPIRTLRVITVDENWSGNLPGGVSDPNYRVEVAGHLKPGPVAARTLVVRAQGAIRVETDGTLRVDEASAPGLREHRIDLGEGEVAIRLIYRHTDGAAVLQAGWASSDVASERSEVRHVREVVLPTGLWHDFWTGDVLTGGQTVERPAPLERMPVLVRAGAIVPLGPIQEWHDQIPDAPVELRIYPGADGAFVLYDDAGDGYGYEQGECSRIHLSWDDEAKTLTLGAREGSYPGMPARRTFHVVRVGPGRGVGLESEAEPEATINYEGREVRVALGYQGGHRNRKGNGRGQI